MDGTAAIPLFAGEPSDKRPKVDRYGDPLPPLARRRIGTTRFRHGGEIFALAFAPDGRSIATLGRDNILSLWDIASGKRRTSFQAPDGVAVAFGEGGKALLWCDVGGRIYHCDAGQQGGDRDGRRQRVQEFNLGSNERIDVVSFKADGSAAVAGTSGNRILFWGREIEIQFHYGLQAVALDRDGQRLAFNERLKGICVREVSGLRERGGIRRAFGNDAVRSLAFSSDGHLLAAGDFENRIRLWDSRTGREMGMLEGHQRVPISGKNGVFCLAFSPDGTRLASGAADGTVRVWDVRSSKEVARCAGHGGRVRALAFTPDGRMLASAGADNVLRLWEPATGRAIGPVPDEGGAVMGVSVSSDGKTLALVQMPGQLRLWDVMSGKELPNKPNLSAPVAALFTPKDRNLVCASVTGQLHFWDCDKEQERRTTRKVPSPIRLLAATADGTTVAWCGNDLRVVLWDIQAGKEIQQYRPQGNRITELVFSPDGEVLLAAGSAGVRLFRFRDKTDRRELLGGVGSVFAVAVSPDGRMAATGGQDGAVRIWEMASGKQRRAMSGDASSLHAVAFSADGAVLATGSNNGHVQLSEVATGKRLHNCAGHRGAVVAVAFAGGASTIISAGVDGTALVWDFPDLLQVGRTKVVELSSQQVQGLWRDLASDDARRAYEAVETLSRAPAQAVSFLREQVTPISVEKMTRRIKELDSDDYTVRIRAVNDLAEMGKFAESALRKLLAAKPSLEARRRAEELLGLLDNPWAITEYLRVLRAVEVLENIGTEPARQALQVLAEGAAEAMLTREAKAALTRLNQNRRK